MKNIKKIGFTFLIFLLLLSCKDRKTKDEGQTGLLPNEIIQLHQNITGQYKQLNIEHAGLCIFSLSNRATFFIDTIGVSTFSVPDEWLRTICKFRHVSKLIFTEVINNFAFQLVSSNNVLSIHYFKQEPLCRSCNLIKANDCKGALNKAIAINKSGFIKIIDSNYKEITSAIDKINKADIIKNHLETSKCIEGWHFQYSQGFKLYWNVIKMPEGKVLTILIPQLKIGIIQTSKQSDWNKIRSSGEDDVVNNPFVAQILEKFAPRVISNQTLLAKIIADLKARRDVRINRMLNNLDSAYNDIQPLASIDYVQNNYYGRRQFTIEKDTEVRVVVAGEGNSIVNPDKDLDREHIELFFDMNNDRKGPVDAKDFDSQYRICVFDSVIYGTYSSLKGIKFAHKFKTRNLCNIEIFIPWDILGYIQPKENVRFGFDVGLSDNDESGRESKLTWHAKNDSAYANTANLGQLKLISSNSGLNSDSLLQSVYTSNPPNLDGIEDNCWKNIKSDTINHLTFGALDNPNDIKGSVKSIWTSKGLYFFLKIYDDITIENSNIKSYCNDYGWIEDNKTHHKIWKMRKANCSLKGNGITDIYCDTTIFLNKGVYNLFYTSDDSHSYMKWFGIEEYLPFYGIKVLPKN